MIEKVPVALILDTKKSIEVRKLRNFEEFYHKNIWWFENKKTRHRILILKEKFHVFHIGLKKRYFTL